MNICLIPARAGSKRLPGKNVKLLDGKPLIWYTLKAAADSGCYDKIAVCTDDPAVRDVCHDHPHLWDFIIDREPVDDLEPDIEWVVPAVEKLGGCETFSILRPTSPFRSALTIQWAWKVWGTVEYKSSLRAVRQVREHPGKMWEKESITPTIARPLAWELEYFPHESWNLPTQKLPTFYVQTAGLEIARANVLPHSISGQAVIPLILDGPEGHDINTPEDWAVAEYYLSR